VVRALEERQLPTGCPVVKDMCRICHVFKCSATTSPFGVSCSKRCAGFVMCLIVVHPQVHFRCPVVNDMCRNCHVSNCSMSGNMMCLTTENVQVYLHGTSYVYLQDMCSVNHACVHYSINL